MKHEFNKKIFFILLTCILAIDIVSTYILLNINQIVHGDLYRFGLEFNVIWANNYWITVDTTQITIWASMILSGLSIGVLYFKELKNRKSVLTLSSILLLSITLIALLNIFLMTTLDKIILTDLAIYGVQYDFQWMHNYYLLSRTFLVLNITATFFAASLSSWTVLPLLKPKQTISKLASFTLILAGALLLLFSTLSSLVLGVNIGIGIVLIGIIINYITSQEFIKKKILTSQLTSTYRYFTENLKQFGEFDKTVYLPSDLTKENNNTVLILKSVNKQNLKTKKSTKIKTTAYTLIPPGNELTQLFEKKLNTNFAKINLDFLQKNLPNLITDDLEIATNLQIKNQEDSVVVEFENSIFNDTEFHEKFCEIIQTFGCPLSSAIGCAIAKATGNLITITEYKIDNRRKTTTVTFNFMRETIKLI